MGSIPSVQALPERLTAAEVRKLCGSLYDREWFQRFQDEKNLVAKKDLIKEASSRNIDETSTILLSNLQQFSEVKRALHKAWDMQEGTPAIFKSQYRTFDRTRDGLKAGECDKQWRQQCLHATGVHVRNVDDLYTAAKVALPLFKTLVTSLLKDAGLPAQPFNHVDHTGNVMFCPTVRFTVLS